MANGAYICATKMNPWVCSFVTRHPANFWWLVIHQWKAYDLPFHFQSLDLTYFELGTHTRVTKFLEFLEVCTYGSFFL